MTQSYIFPLFFYSNILPMCGTSNDRGDLLMCTECSSTLEIHAFALQVIPGVYPESLRLFSWSPMYLFICFPQCCITCPILWPAHPSLLQAGSGLYVRAHGHATHTHTCCQPLMNTFFTTMLLHYTQPHVLSFSLCPIAVSCCPTALEKECRVQEYTYVLTHTEQRNIQPVSGMGFFVTEL